jgi:hypothetical protein
MPLSFLGRHQLLAFVAVTYAVSWVIWWGMASTSLSIATPTGAVLNVIALSGPSLTALVLSAVLGGSTLRRLLAGFAISRASPRLVLVALGLPLVTIAIRSIAISCAPRTLFVRYSVTSPARAGRVGAGSEVAGLPCRC